jgi:hypothetical protein
LKLSVGRTQLASVVFAYPARFLVPPDLFCVLEDQNAVENPVHVIFETSRIGAPTLEDPWIVPVDIPGIELVTLESCGNSGL